MDCLGCAHTIEIREGTAAVTQKCPFSYTPPMPDRRPAGTGTIGLLKRMRRDFLSIWADSDFRDRVMTTWILRRKVVIANSPDAVREVMVTGNANFERKSPQMRRALEYLLGDGLFISDGETWKQRRPIVSKVVQRQHLRAFSAIMVDSSTAMADGWQRLEAPRQLDMLGEMAALTADIIGKCVFGRGVSREDAKEIIEGFTTYQEHIDQTNLGYFFGWDEGWPVRKNKEVRRAAERVRKVVDRLIDDLGTPRADGASMLALMATGDGDASAAMNREALINEAATIFMAGHETTAATLTWAWFLLSQAGWAEEKLHEELDRVLGGRPPTFDDVSSLTYTKAIIQETLRLYPPVPILARQVKETRAVHREPAKKGGLALVCPWLLHRHEIYWDAPNTFQPERFLEGPPPTNVYVPFAVGPRICPGAQFGQTEAILCLATLAQRFRPTLAPGHVVEPQCRLTLRPKGGLPMLLNVRDAA